MNAIVFPGVGDIILDDVPEPTIQEPTDAIIHITASSTCGTDLHFIRGSAPDMQSGTILGHAGLGVIEALGDDVHDLQIDDRELIPSTIGCGNCSYCRAGYFAQCDVANPNVKKSGSSFFWRAKINGSFHEFRPKRQHSIRQLMGAGRVFGIDALDDRLTRARHLAAGCINFEDKDPVKTILKFTDGIGIDRAVDGVGIDANHSHNGHPHGRAQWQPGGRLKSGHSVGPRRTREAGMLSMIGVHPAGFDSFPIGAPTNNNFGMNMGNCHHHKYIPSLFKMTLEGKVDPGKILTQSEHSQMRSVLSSRLIAMSRDE